MQQLFRKLWKNEMGKIVVVGTGFSGAVVARELAEKLNRNILVVEKRSHIAGNMYDEMDEHNILIQKYGPRVVVTNEWKVIDYLSKFSEMSKHVIKEVSIIDGKYVRLPFNFESLQQLVGADKSQDLIAKMRKYYEGRDRVPITELVKSEDRDIANFAQILFEKSFRTYCAKQWNLPPETLDISIMGRSAFAMNYDERYMNKDFQYIPKNGFTKLFENILSHRNITLRLNEDAVEHIHFDDVSKKIFYDKDELDCLVFTGAIDELFHIEFGELPYRSLDIKYEWFDVEKKYPEKIISCPQALGYVRKTEYKFLMDDYSKTKGTVIATEYPIEYVKGENNTPYYPVITEKTKQRYQQYTRKVQQYKNLFLCGRLAEFKYYNMDDCILQAMRISENIIRKL